MCGSVRSLERVQFCGCRARAVFSSEYALEQRHMGLFALMYAKTIRLHVQNVCMCVCNGSVGARANDSVCSLCEDAF